MNLTFESGLIYQRENNLSLLFLITSEFERFNIDFCQWPVLISGVQSM